jgi:hypothetical protein
LGQRTFIASNKQYGSKRALSIRDATQEAVSARASLVGVTDCVYRLAEAVSARAILVGAPRCLYRKKRGAVQPRQMILDDSSSRSLLGRLCALSMRAFSQETTVGTYGQHEESPQGPLYARLVCAVWSARKTRAYHVMQEKMSASVFHQKIDPHCLTRESAWENSHDARLLSRLCSDSAKVNLRTLPFTGLRADCPGENGENARHSFGLTRVSRLHHFGDWRFALGIPKRPSRQSVSSLLV